MRPGLVSITLRALPVGEVIEGVVAAGLEGIEWGGDVHVPHGDLATALEVAKRTTEAGLEVASYGSYYKFGECDPAGDRAGPSMTAVLETAEALGAPAVRVWAGIRGPADTSPAVRAAIVSAARWMAEAAASRGLRLDFEFHADTLTETAASTRELLDAIGHPSARTLWQPPLQMPPAERLEGLRALGPRISNLHCNHFGQDAWPHIHALEEGETEWAADLAALPPAKESRWVLLEHVRGHALEAVREDAATLRRWLSTR